MYTELLHARYCRVHAHSIPRGEQEYNVPLVQSNHRNDSLDFNTTLLSKLFICNVLASQLC